MLSIFTDQLGVANFSHQNLSYDEILEIEALKRRLKPFANINLESSVEWQGESLPIYSFRLGEKRDNPNVVMVAGVHGLERIGVRVLISFLHTIASWLEWDEAIRMQLTKINLLFYPCVNPAGLVAQTRSNPNKVDLMRNAPIEASSCPKYFLPGGQRFSSRLPWYRGKKDAPMEKEAIALYNFIKRETWESPYTIVIDVHSGFGMRDRLWFPYAYSPKPFPLLAEIFAFKKLMDQTIPHHIYSIEPQSINYLAHGDLWDFLFIEQRKVHGNRIFLPLCLELGSWLWIKKNPWQLFNILGVFNPIKPHRLQRTLRRHLVLLDFLIRSTLSYTKWLNLSDEQRRMLTMQAYSHWYRKY